MFKNLEVVYKMKSVNSKNENFKAIHLKNSFLAEDLEGFNKWDKQRSSA